MHLLINHCNGWFDIDLSCLKNLIPRILHHPLHCRWTLCLPLYHHGTANCTNLVVSFELQSGFACWKQCKISKGHSHRQRIAFSCLLKERGWYNNKSEHKKLTKGAAAAAAVDSWRAGTTHLAIMVQLIWQSPGCAYNVQKINNWPHKMLHWFANLGPHDGVINLQIFYILLHVPNFFVLSSLLYLTSYFWHPKCNKHNLNLLEYKICCDNELESFNNQARFRLYESLHLLVSDDLQWLT